MARLSDPVRLLIRLDASHHTGLGHAARVAELMKHITAPLDIHICGSGDQLGVYFADNVIFHMLDEEEPEAQKSVHLLKIAGEIEADILMIDQSDQTRESWQYYDNSPFPVIAIDDYGGNVQADLLFNGTILKAYHHYPLISDKTCIFCGGAYALLNPAFGKLSRKPSRERTLLVVIGGGDRAQQWAFSLAGDQSPFLPESFEKITMIVGATFANSAELRHRCKKLHIKLHQNITQAQLARMLSRHSMALVTGGMIVYEMLASGCPGIIFPQEKNLIREAEWFGKYNAVINLGYEGGMDMKRVEKALETLRQELDSETACLSGGPGKIDGKGMIRAAVKINDFLQKFFAGQQNR